MISKEHADILKTIFAMFLSQLNFLSQNDQKVLSVPVTDVWFHLHLTISSLLHISKLIGPLFCFGFFFFGQHLMLKSLFGPALRFNPIDALFQ